MLSGLVIPAAYLTVPLHQSSGDKLSSSRPNVEGDEDGQRRSVQRCPKSTWESSKIQLIHFDVLGIFLGVPGLLLLTYALTSGNISGWGVPVDRVYSGSGKRPSHSFRLPSVQS